MELDTGVQSYELEAPEYRTQIDGEWVTTRFDAKVKRWNNTERWDEVKYEISDDPDETMQRRAQIQLAREYGAEYRLFQAKDFEGQLTRVWNGLRMLQTIAMTKNYSLAAARTFLVARLLSGPCTLSEVRTLGDEDDALNLAAAFALTLEGRAYMDLDSEALSDMHSIALEERA